MDAIVLHPDLAVFNIHMQNTGMDALWPLPANLPELIVPSLIVENELGLHIRIRQLELAVLLKNLMERPPK